MSTAHVCTEAFSKNGTSIVSSITLKVFILRVVVQCPSHSQKGGLAFKVKSATPNHRSVVLRARVSLTSGVAPQHFGGEAGHKQQTRSSLSSAISSVETRDEILGL